MTSVSIHADKDKLQQADLKLCIYFLQAIVSIPTEIFLASSDFVHIVNSSDALSEYSLTSTWNEKCEMVLSPSEMMLFLHQCAQTFSAHYMYLRCRKDFTSTTATYNIWSSVKT